MGTQVLIRDRCRKIGRTYRTPVLLFGTVNLESWQARYTWVFFQFCVDSYEKLENMDCKGRTRFETDCGLFGICGECYGAGRGGQRAPLLFLPIDGCQYSTVRWLIRSSEFIRNENTTNLVRHPGTTIDTRCQQQRFSQRPAEHSGRTTHRAFVRCRAHPWRLCRPVVVCPTAFPFLPLQSLFLVYGCPRLATTDKAQSNLS